MHNLFNSHSLIRLESKQQELLDKIESIPCGSADNLGKLAAKNEFIDGHKRYCLVKNPSITVEGGKIFSYLFIENGTAQVIIDVRDDFFSGCCVFLRAIMFDTMQFGFDSEGTFIEQTSLSEVDLNNEYILKLSAEGVVDRNY